MSTIDELRQRRRDLLSQKQDLLNAQGPQCDPLALFMLEEELLDVKAQLRALSPNQRIGARRTTNNAYAADCQQFTEWSRTDADEAAEERHAVMLRAARQALDTLKPRQKEMLLLLQKGATMTEVAAMLGICVSTASRTAHRAKANMRHTMESILNGQNLPLGCLDLSDPSAAKLVLSELTSVQAVYLYLYYSEWLSLREIAALTNIDASSICRTIHRALRNIGKAFAGASITMINIDALDELAYNIYAAMPQSDLSNLVPASLRPVPTAPHDHNKIRKYTQRSKTYKSVDQFCVQIDRPHNGPSNGKLLEALKAKGTVHSSPDCSLFQALKSVFQRLIWRVKSLNTGGKNYERY